MKKLMIVLFFISLFEGCFETGYKKSEKYKNIKIQQQYFSEDMKRFNRLYSYRHICRGQMEVGSNPKPDSLGYLESCEITGKVLIDSLVKFKKLSNLSIICNDYTSEPVFQFDCEGLKKLDRLSFLSCNFPRHIIIKHGKKLKLLYIYARKDSTNIESIQLSNPSSIETLILDNCNISRIPSIIKKMANLEYLSLGNNNIYEINFDDLPKNLKTIWLNSNKISNINIDDLPKNLKTIGLKNNPILKKNKEILRQKLKQKGIYLHDSI